MDLSSPKPSVPLFIVLLFYFLPVSIWIFYTYYHAPHSYSWAVAVIGIAIVCMGSALFFSLLRSLEEEPPEPAKAAFLPNAIAPELIDELKASFELERAALHKKLEEKQTEIQSQSLVLEEIQEQVQKTSNEKDEIAQKLTSLQNEQAEHLEGKNSRIDELSGQLNHKQLLIQQLENQINDLRYEIKTLLQLTEVDYRSLESEAASALPKILENSEIEDTTPIQVTSDDEAKKLLNRCIDKAEKMTSSLRASSLNSATHEPYVFDLRRLKEAFQGEEGALIFVFSSKENRVLFANKETKKLLGCTSEKFAQDFHQMILEGLFAWKTSLSELLAKNEVALNISFKSKTGQQNIRLMLGTIPSGAFRSLIIVIGYSVS